MAISTAGDEKLCRTETISDEIADFIRSLYQNPEYAKTPTCYVYDLESIRDNVAILERYAPPQLKLYYAMKANPHPRILECVRDLQFVRGVEIASSGELTEALRFFHPDEILFTGPGKTEQELESSIKNKIRLINIESVVEAMRINTIAERFGINQVDVLIRINPNYCIHEAQEHMAGVSSKFGIDENDLLSSCQIITALPRINIKGIHVFAASGVLEYKDLITYTKYIFDLVLKLEDALGPIKVIDFGGGLGIDYSTNNLRFNVHHYCKELAQLIDDYHYENKDIIMELGTYLVGNAGLYTAEIIDIKASKGRYHVILGGGINHMGLPLEMKRKHPLHIIPMNRPSLYSGQLYIENETVDIHGPLCMSSDMLSWDEFIPRAAIGDIAVYRQSGAYCLGLGMVNFLSHPYPQEVFIDDFRTPEANTAATSRTEDRLRDNVMPTARSESYGGFVFREAAPADFSAMLLLEQRYFNKYDRIMDKKLLAKWYNHNQHMFFVVEKKTAFEQNRIYGFAILVPIAKELLDQICLGKCSDLFSFDLAQVERSFDAKYLFVEEICIDKELPCNRFASLELTMGIMRILKKHTLKAAASPITHEGKLLSTSIGFKFSAIDKNESYQGQQQAIYVLERTPESLAVIEKTERLYSAIKARQEKQQIKAPASNCSPQHEGMGNARDTRRAF